MEHDEYTGNPFSDGDWRISETIKSLRKFWKKTREKILGPKTDEYSQSRRDALKKIGVISVGSALASGGLAVLMNGVIESSRGKETNRGLADNRLQALSRLLKERYFANGAILFSISNSTSYDDYGQLIFRPTNYALTRAADDFLYSAEAGGNRSRVFIESMQQVGLLEKSAGLLWRVLNRNNQAQPRPLNYSGQTLLEKIDILLSNSPYSADSIRINPYGEASALFEAEASSTDEGREHWRQLHLLLMSMMNRALNEIEESAPNDQIFNLTPSQLGLFRDNIAALRSDIDQFAEERGLLRSGYIGIDIASLHQKESQRELHSVDNTADQLQMTYNFAYFVNHYGNGVYEFEGANMANPNNLNFLIKLKIDTPSSQPATLVITPNGEELQEFKRLWSAYQQRLAEVHHNKIRELLGLSTLSQGLPWDIEATQQA